MSEPSQINSSSTERHDTEVCPNVVSASSSSDRQSDSETDVSMPSTSPSPTTSLDENIIARTYHAASNIPHIHYSHKLQRDHSMNNFGSRTTQTAFDRAYELYARTSHMGILDPTYKVFTSQNGYGFLIYKIRARTVIVLGDPLCSEECRKPLLNELRHFRWARGLALIFVGISEDFVKYAQQQGWMTIHFGHERVLNPLTNKVLRNEAGKRMVTQNKQLLDPKRGGISVHLYSPSITKAESDLEDQLQKLYDDWRHQRNRKYRGSLQAFVTVYDLFSHPESTITLYTSDCKNQLKGFAILRKLGKQTGYHIDPCIASQDAPRGITDLLIVAAMQLLKSSGISYLSLGFDPLDNIQGINGQSKLQSWLWKRGYNHMVKSAPVTGKAAYFKKFYPDESLASKLFICLPSKGIPLRESIALLQFANLNIRQLFTESSPTDQHGEKQPLKCQ
ncbi:hypothetical protein ACKLNR_014453 [Fusarium oxysporum f. sp. zingiberi]